MLSNDGYVYQSAKYFCNTTGVWEAIGSDLECLRNYFLLFFQLLKDIIGKLLGFFS
jgi:hypothetical protein